MTLPTASELRPILLPLALKIVRSYFPFGRLDYSPNSVHIIEKTLGKLHKEFVRQGSDEGVWGTSLEFAAYIVEVIDRNYGPVDWQRDDSQFGQDSFPLYWRGTTLFPLTWCLKRILEGEEDNVWDKFSIIVMDDGNSN